MGDGYSMRYRRFFGIFFYFWFQFLISILISILLVFSFTLFSTLFPALAYLNRYPNPYAKHVLSSDTLLQEIDKDGKLRLTRVAVKTGRLPNFIKPFLGTLLDSWIVEKIIIDPKNLVMKTYNSNIDHQKFIRVEEYLHYTATSANTTKVGGKVKFSSNFIGFKKKIED